MHNLLSCYADELLLNWFCWYAYSRPYYVWWCHGDWCYGHTKTFHLCLDLIFNQVYGRTNYRFQLTACTENFVFSLSLWRTKRSQYSYISRAEAPDVEVLRFLEKTWHGLLCRRWRSDLITQAGEAVRLFMAQLHSQTMWSQMCSTNMFRPPML